VRTLKNTKTAPTKTIGELRQEAEEYLEVSIEDGDPSLMRVWLKAIGDERVRWLDDDERPIRAIFTIAQMADSASRSKGEGCDRARCLIDALPKLGNIALVRLIETYGRGTGDALDEFVDAIDKVE